MINKDVRNDSQRQALSSDDYLTPPDLIKALGVFDLDPCCPPNMPWTTAKYMMRQGLDLVEDGLAMPWQGRVFCNPPYSEVMPWAEKFVMHQDGILLVPAKSTDTKWAQLVLQSCHGVLFLAGRLLFHRPDGSATEGKWMPSMLVALGDDNVDCLNRIRKGPYPGALLR